MLCSTNSKYFCSNWNYFVQSGGQAEVAPGHVKLVKRGNKMEVLLWDWDRRHVNRCNTSRTNQNISWFETKNIEQKNYNVRYFRYLSKYRIASRRPCLENRKLIFEKRKDEYLETIPKSQKRHGVVQKGNAEILTRLVWTRRFVLTERWVTWPKMGDLKFRAWQLEEVGED